MTLRDWKHGTSIDAHLAASFEGNVERDGETDVLKLAGHFGRTQSSHRCSRGA